MLPKPGAQVLIPHFENRPSEHLFYPSFTSHNDGILSATIDFGVNDDGDDDLKEGSDPCGCGGKCRHDVIARIEPCCCHVSEISSGI